MGVDGTGSPRATLTLATFNVHMGVDGWGRPWDVVGECRSLDADVIVMQESWTPDGNGPSTAGRVAEALGYRVVDEVELARVRLYAPVATSSSRWAPRPGQASRALHFQQSRRSRPERPARREFARGRWALAIVARVPVRDVEVIDLGKLRRDPARRVAISCRTDLGGREVTIVGTHMSHITHGSHAQYRRLGARLPHADTAAVLAGDMNLWGPPVNSYFPAWRRAFTGRTWPTRRPHSQLDHVLITPSLSAVDARVAPRSGSDHRPVVVTLALARTGTGAPGSVPSMPDALAGFEKSTFAAGGETRDIYRTGSGPAVIVMSEIPGITPHVAEFGRSVAGAGLTAVLPHLFGDDGREPSGGYAFSSFTRACVSKEFTVLALGQTSPIIAWLRALARDEHQRCGGPGVGAVGMCFTGGFALGMMVDDVVVAPVLAQPSLPLPFSKSRRRALGLSESDQARVVERVAAGTCVLGLRFTGDTFSPPDRFEHLRELLGDGFVGVELDSSADNPHGHKKRAHSVLTGDLDDRPGTPTRAALDQVLAFFTEHLTG